MSDLLAIALSAAVPLQIMGMQQRELSGPVEHEWNAAREFGVELASRGDVLLYGGKPGEAADLFNRLGKSIAVLAFCPGGVSIFGMLFCAKHHVGGATRNGICLECVSESGPMDEVPVVVTARNRTRTIMITARKRSR